MKNRFNKANTLVEVLLVLLVVGIVIGVITLTMRKGRPDASIRYAYYNVFTTMQTVASEILSKSANSQLPANVTGFCDAARLELNTVSFNCGLGVNPVNNPALFNFETSSTVRFYNGAAGVNSYTFLMDVNGREGGGDVEILNNNKSDIFRFVVYPQDTNGYYLLPAVDSKAVTLAGFLTATVISKPNGDGPNSLTNVVAPNVSYREAVCIARMAPAAYCNAAPAIDRNAPVGLPNPCRANVADWNPAPVNPCRVVINKPAPPLKL